MPSSPLLAELQRLEVELHHPGVPCTPARLDALLHPDFHEVGRSGRVYDRDTVRRHLATRTSLPVVESRDFALTRLGEASALLTYRSCTVEAHGRRSHHALRASVWLRSGAGWQLRYHQGTPEAEAAP